MKLPEPTWFQYRWLNPANDPVHKSRLQWEDITANWDESVVEQCEELSAYKYQGKPTYEVRGLYTEAQLKQAVRDALEAAAKLIEGTEMSGLQSDPKMQLFIAQLLSGYVTAIRKLKEGL